MDVSFPSVEYHDFNFWESGVSGFISMMLLLTVDKDTPKRKNKLYNYNGYDTKWNIILLSCIHYALIHNMK